MINDYYSPLKIFHHQDRIAALRDGKRPQLLHVQIVPTNRCNQNCDFCAYRAHGYSSNVQFETRDQLSWAKLEEVINDCAAMGVKAIELTGGGEPTIHPNFVDICNTIRANKLDYGVVTNGSNLSAAVLDALAGARWVRFSLDAGCAATYSAIRHTAQGTFNKVRSNIRALCSRRTDQEPIVGVGFVVTNANWKEVVQAAINAKEDGADNFRISAVFQTDGVQYFQDFYAEAKELCRQAKELEDGIFTVFNLFGERINDLEQKQPSDSFCGFQQLCTYIGADAGVYRCCVISYNPLGFLGSIKERSFKELWESSETEERLCKFDARRCPRCMFHNKNQTIRYAIRRDPPHVNFL